MKQPKQPRPDVDRVVRTVRPGAETRPVKPARPEGPDGATAVAQPPDPGTGRVAKGTNGSPIPDDSERRPGKTPFAAAATEPHVPPDSYPDQIPRVPTPHTVAVERRAGGQGEQYVRLRMRLRGEQLSVIDSHLVDGPLGQVTGFPGGNAYEVTLDGRLLHAGALPDFGIQRSFPNPGGPASQRGHFVTERDVVEFAARVPADELTPDTIRRVQVTLHRVTEEARVPRLGPEPLLAQFEHQLRPVSTLVGVPTSALPEAIEARGGRTPTV